MTCLSLEDARWGVAHVEWTLQVYAEHVTCKVLSARYGEDSDGWDVMGICC